MLKNQQLGKQPQARLMCAVTILRDCEISSVITVLQPLLARKTVYQEVPGVIQAIYNNKAQAGEAEEEELLHFIAK